MGIYRLCKRVVEDDVLTIRGTGQKSGKKESQLFRGTVRVGTSGAGQIDVKVDGLTGASAYGIKFFL